jgi:hypothetical protein
VMNTPKLLVEIIGDLVHQVITQLASQSGDLRIVAANALGDVVRRLVSRYVVSATYIVLVVNLSGRSCFEQCNASSAERS